MTDIMDKQKHPNKKRKQPKVIVYIPIFTGHDDQPRKSNRDSCSNSDLPNVYDPDFHCRVCDTTETSLSDYVRHLATVHDMDKQGRVQKMKKVASKENRFSSKDMTKANEEDNEKAALSDNSSEDKMMISSDEDEETVLSEEEDDLYEENDETDDSQEEDDMYTCVISNRRRRNNRGSTQKTDREAIKETDPNAAPDINDPNHYCFACKIKHPTRGAYRFHLKKEHQIQHIPVKPRDLHYSDTVDHDFIPDENALIEQLVNATSVKQQPMSMTVHKKKPLVDNQNKPLLVNNTDKPTLKSYYCNTCETNLQSTARYQIHVEKYHKKMNRDKEDTIQPNVRDPDFYCQVCKITKPNRRAYLTHLSIIHKINNCTTANGRKYQM
jgi:hypothetical protein